MGNSCKNCNCKKNDEKSNNEIDAERLKDIINKFKNNPKLFKTLIKIQNIFRGMLLRSKMDLKNDNYPLNLKKGKLASKPEKKLYNNYNTTNDKNELIEDNTDIFSYVIQNNTNQNYNKSNNVLLETDNLGLTEAENNLYDEENKNPEQNEKLKDRIKNKFDKILNNPESNKNENNTENKKLKNDNNNDIQQTDNKSEVEYSINSNNIFKKMIKI